MAQHPGVAAAGVVAVVLVYPELEAELVHVQYSTEQYSTVQYSTVQYSRLLAGVGAPRPHPGAHPLVAGDAVARPAGTRAGVLGVVLDTGHVDIQEKEYKEKYLDSWVTWQLQGGQRLQEAGQCSRAQSG